MYVCVWKNSQGQKMQSIEREERIGMQQREREISQEAETRKDPLTLKFIPRKCVTGRIVWSGKWYLAMVNNVWSGEISQNPYFPF